MNDSQIVGLYLKRNENAIRETEKKYGRLCRRIAHNLLGNSEDAEECENDTYLGVWNSIPPELPRSLAAYVCRIARNLALKRLEYKSAEKRSAEALVSLEELEELFPQGANDELDDGVLTRAIEDFLRGEKEDARNVFMRKYWFFDSISDIAEAYSFSESKVKSMLFNTRKRLKDYLIKEGLYQ